MEKSHVSMEQHICIVCGAKYDTGAILLDKRLKASMECYTLTGNGLCPDHQKLHDDGYIALVGVDPSRSSFSSDGNLTQSGAYRTGSIMHLKRDKWGVVFNCPMPEGPLAFLEEQALEEIKSKMP